MIVVKIIVGGLAILLSLWGGAYLFEELKNSWAHFPAYATAFVVGCIGVIFLVTGLVEEGV